MNGKISVDENVKIHRAELNGNIEIGEYASLWGLNIDVYTGREHLYIGKFCSIARLVTIQLYNHNRGKIMTYHIGRNIFGEEWENEKVYKGPTIVKNDV